MHCLYGADALLSILTVEDFQNVNSLFRKLACHWREELQQEEDEEIRMKNE